MSPGKNDPAFTLMSLMSLTPEQARAIHTEANRVLVTAAAGSGKTHVLAQRYIHIVENEPERSIASIVAITFTRATAREMKDRVRRYFTIRLQEAKNSREKKFWQKRITEIPQARIQTIHSLCRDIIRDNAAVIGIDPRFRILDEAESAHLREEMIREVLAADDHAGQDYRKLFGQFATPEIRKAFRRVQFPVPKFPLAGELLGQWQDEWRARAAVKFAEFCREYSIPFLDVPSDDALGERCLQAAHHLEAIHLAHNQDDRYAEYEHLRELAVIRLTAAGKKDRWGSQFAKDEATAQLKRWVTAARCYRDEIGAPPDGLDRAAADDLQLWWALIHRVQQRYIQIKLEKNALDYDDLEWLCAQLLQEDAIRERYQEEIGHILADEFQDVNQRQWQIMQALSDGYEHKSLFLVGDPCQSIYSFRGADVSVFQQVKKKVGAGFTPYTLSQSFRSHAPFMAGLNDFFDCLFQREENQALLEFEVEEPTKMVCQRETAPEYVAHIELCCIDQTALKKAELPADRKAARKWEAALLAERLLAIVAQQEKIIEPENATIRPARFNDIAILFRSFSDINLYEEVFTRLGLPFKSYAGRGLFDRQEVWDAVNFMKSLHNPLEDLALASVLRSPFGNLSDDALYLLRAIREDSTQQRLPLIQQVQKAAAGQVADFPDDELRPLQRFLAMYTSLARMLGRVSVFELLSEMMNRSAYPAIVGAQNDGEQSRNNLAKLLEISRIREHTQLADFLDFIQRNRRHELPVAQAEISSSDTVSLMSIHSSKGLEFPIVVLADIGRRLESDPKEAFLDPTNEGPACIVLDERREEIEGYAYRKAKAIKIKKAAAEEKRIMYVAATRARDRLILSGMVHENKKGGWQKEGANWEAVLDWFGKDALAKLEPDVPVLKRYSWGRAQLYLAKSPPAHSSHSQQASPIAPISRIIADQPPIAAAIDTSLLEKVAESPSAKLHNLAASQLNATRSQPSSHHVFADEVSTSAESAGDRDEVEGTSSHRELGLLLHAALRQHPLPMPGKPLQEYLRGLCWKMAFGDTERAALLITEAVQVLEKYRNSSLYSELSSVPLQAIHREFPLTYRRQSSLIHGRIDLLYQKSDGKWCILDYKTNRLPSGRFLETALAEHAKRYDPQMAAYHQAIHSCKEFQPLMAAIHYLQHGVTLTIPEERLKQAGQLAGN